MQSSETPPCSTAQERKKSLGHTAHPKSSLCLLEDSLWVKAVLGCAGRVKIENKESLLQFGPYRAQFSFFINGGVGVGCDMNMEVRRQILRAGGGLSC